MVLVWNKIYWKEAAKHDLGARLVIIFHVSLSFLLASLTSEAQLRNAHADCFNQYPICASIGWTVSLARLPCLFVHASVIVWQAFILFRPRAVCSAAFMLVWAACKPFSQLLSRLTSFRTIWSGFLTGPIRFV